MTHRTTHMQTSYVHVIKCTHTCAHTCARTRTNTHFQTQHTPGWYTALPRSHPSKCPRNRRTSTTSTAAGPACTDKGCAQPLLCVYVCVCVCVYVCVCGCVYVCVYKAFRRYACNHEGQVQRAQLQALHAQTMDLHNRLCVLISWKGVCLHKRRVCTNALVCKYHGKASACKNKGCAQTPLCVNITERRLPAQTKGVHKRPCV